MDLFPPDILGGLVYFARTAPVATNDAGADAYTDTEVVNARGYEGLVPTDRALLQWFVDTARRWTVVVSGLDTALYLVFAEDREVSDHIVSEPQVLGFVAEIVGVDLCLAEAVEVRMPVEREKGVDVSPFQLTVSCSSVAHRMGDPDRFAQRADLDPNNVVASIAAVIFVAPEGEQRSKRWMSFWQVRDGEGHYLRLGLGRCLDAEDADLIRSQFGQGHSDAVANVFRIPGAPNVGAGAAEVSTKDSGIADGQAKGLTRQDKRDPSPTGPTTPQPAVTAGYPGARQLRRRGRSRSGATG
jgi:hypothetical protein